MRRAMFLLVSLSLVAAGSAAAEEPVSVTSCANVVPPALVESLPPACVAATAEATEGDVTAAADASACTVVVTACAQVMARPRVPVADLLADPVHPVRRTPAAGTITITVGEFDVDWTGDGVFATDGGLFTCDLTSYAPHTVECTPNDPRLGWYCAGWVLTAGPPAGGFASLIPGDGEKHVRGQTSCDGTTGEAPSGGSQTLSTRVLWEPAYTRESDVVTALNLDWPVVTSIICQAWGDPGYGAPVAVSTVTCSEPGLAP